MERIPKMLNYLNDDLTKELQNWKQQLSNLKAEKTKATIEQFKDQAETEETCIVITYLRSSYITKKHQFKIALYEKAPFTKETTMYQYMNLSALYKQVPAQMENFTKKLQTKYSSVLNSEIEEIRRAYMELLYQNTNQFFENVLAKIPKTKPTIKVYFGEELDEVKEIGVIEQ